MNTGLYFGVFLLFHKYHRFKMSFAKTFKHTKDITCLGK